MKAVKPKVDGKRLNLMVHCMSKTLLQICVCLVLVKVACAAKAGEAYLSPLAVVADKQGKNLYVAEATAKQVAVFDITSEKVVKVIPLPDQPSGLALAPDGSSLYVTGVSPKGRVYVVNPATGRISYTYSNRASG